MSGFTPLDVLALEAVRVVSKKLGIASADLKPCIAYHLAGHEALASQHKVLFTLAIELRRLGWTAERVEAVLAELVNRSGGRLSAAKGAVRSAFRKKPDGEWRYHPPGLHKQGAVYAEVLKPICDELGCPANCPAFAGKYQGPVSETFERFQEIGWETLLKKKRQRAAIDVYQAICRREKQLKLAPGAEILTSYRRLAELAGIHATTAGDGLRRLETLGLITFVAGSGSGPHARDRIPSKVRRVVPIPPPPGSPIGAIRAGRHSRPHIGRRKPRQPGNARHFQSWGGTPKRRPTDSAINPAEGRDE